MGEQTARRWAPVVVAALVLVVVGGTWALLRGNGSALSPGSGGSDGGASDRPLRLMGWTAAGGGTADPRYSLADDAELPQGPGHAAVHRVVPVTDDGALRSALGRLALTLVVGPDGQWQAGPRAVCAATPPAAPDAPVSSDDTPALGGTTNDQPCARADGPDTGSAAKDPLPGRDAVLEALGLAGEQTHDISLVAQPDGTELYALDPHVSGLPTSGLRTALVGSSDGTFVTSGAGWLVRTPELADYPVVPAADAYQLLRRTPLPMPLMACPEPLPEGTDPVPCGGPITVTGARLGLSLQQSADGYLLVPAWFFTVAGSDNPLAQVAVEPSLVEAAAPAGGGSSGSSGSGGGAVPPATASAAPPSVVPGEPVPAPQSRFTAVSRSRDDRSLDVTFWGGVEACYSYDVRAEEDGSRVRIWLVERTPHSDKPCIDLAMERQATVALDRPLGLRTVEDGDTGTVLLGPSK